MFCSDIDAKQTYRIREIMRSPQKAFYGREPLIVAGYPALISTGRCGGAHNRVRLFQNSVHPSAAIPRCRSSQQVEVFRGNVILDTVDLETPPFERETTGMWLDVPRGTIQIMRSKGLNPAEGIHAAQHAILNRFSMAADLQTECKVSKKEYKANQSSRKRPARWGNFCSLEMGTHLTPDSLVFYDKGGGNGGIAAKAFDHGKDVYFAICHSHPTPLFLSIQPSTRCIQDRRKLHVRRRLCQL